MRLPNVITLEEAAVAAAPQGASEKAAVLNRGALTESASVRTATATPRDASHVAEGKVVKGVTATALGGKPGGGGGSGGRARVGVGVRGNVAVGGVHVVWSRSGSIVPKSRASWRVERLGGRVPDPA